MNQDNSRNRIVKTVAILDITVGCFVLAAWILDWSFFLHLGIAGASMKVNTALCFFFLGVILLFHQSKYQLFANIAAYAVFGISIAVLMEYITHRDFGIDQLVVYDHSIQKGRMSVGSATSFLLLSYIYLETTILKAAKKYIKTFPLLLVGIISTFSVFGYILQVNPEDKIFFIGSMAPHTSVVIFLNTLAFAVMHIDGFWVFFKGDSTGNKIARTLGSIQIGFMLVFGLLINFLLRNNIIEITTGLDILIIFNVSLIVISLSFIAHKYNIIYLKQKHTQQELTKVNLELQDIVSHRTQKLKNTIDFLNTTNRVAKIGGWEYYPPSEKMTWTQMAKNIYQLDINTRPTLELMMQMFVDESSKVRFAKLLNDSLGIGASWEAEFKIRTTGSEEKWVMIIGHPQMENGQCILIHGTIQDITKSKLVEQNLENERKFLQKVIDNIPVNIYVKDLNSRKILINKQELLHMESLAEQDVLGKSDFDLFPEDPARISRAEDLEVFSGKPIFNKQTQLTLTSGKTYHFLTYKTPLYDEHKNIIGLVGVSVDVDQNGVWLSARKEKDSESTES